MFILLLHLLSKNLSTTGGLGICHQRQGLASRGGVCAGDNFDTSENYYICISEVWQ